MATRLPSFLNRPAKPLTAEALARAQPAPEAPKAGPANPIFRAGAPSLLVPPPAPAAPAPLSRETPAAGKRIFRSGRPELVPRAGQAQVRPDPGQPEPPPLKAAPPERPAPAAPEVVPVFSRQPRAGAALMPRPEPEARALPPTLLPASPPPRLPEAPAPKQRTRKAAGAKAPAAAARPASSPDPAQGFRVVPLPRLSQGGRWRTEAMRSYSVPLLLWFTRGQGRITVAGTTRGFTAHNAVFLPPGTMHGFEMSGQVFGHAVFLPRDSALQFPDRPHHLRFRDALEQNELSQMIEHLQREIDRALPGAGRALTLHAGLLAVWFDRQIAALETADTPENAARRLAAGFTALVERDFRLGRSIASYARDLGVTPTHLTRSCNSACGRAAHDILADRLFFEARSLLRDTAMPVKAIAEALGFTSAAYFTRAFQKATGETPSGFRRKG